MKKYFIRGVNPVILAIIGLLIIGVSFAGCRHIGAYLYGDEFYGEYYYETDSVDDYLYLPHNDTIFSGEFWAQGDMIEYPKLMFPPKIESYFTDIDYHLKAYGFLGTVYEVTLEFKIEDREQFKHYVSTLLGDRETTPFPFDDEWVEYVQSDKYSVYDHFYSDDPNITEPDVISCHIGKVLINYEKQRIFFVVMVEYDCDFYSYEYTNYFSRFNIDIGEYAKYTEQNEWTSYQEDRRRALFK